MRVRPFSPSVSLPSALLLVGFCLPIALPAETSPLAPPPPAAPSAVTPAPADVTHLQPGAKVVVNWGGDRIGEFLGYARTGWLRVRVLGKVGMVQELTLPPAKVRLATDADSNLPPPPPPGAPHGSILPPPPGSPGATPDPSATPILPRRLLKPEGSPKPAHHYKMGDKVWVSLMGGLHPSVWKAEGQFVSYDKGGYALVLVRQGKNADTLRVRLNAIRPINEKDDDVTPDAAPPGATPSAPVPPAAPETNPPKKISA